MKGMTVFMVWLFRSRWCWHFKAKTVYRFVIDITRERPCTSSPANPRRYHLGGRPLIFAR